MTFKSDIWLLLWIGLVALVAYAAKLKKKETVLGQETERYSLLFAIITFLPVFLFVSVGEIRSDIWLYLSSFDRLSMSINEVFQNWWTNKDPGFTLIEVIIKQIFGNNRDAFRIVFALMQSIPLVLVYRKYSVDYVLSVFLFITMGYYSGWMMNGLRQFLAACIIFAATPLLIKKKIVPTVFIILLAMTIHTSAMMMIPIALVVWFEPWKKGILISFIVFVVALFVFVNTTDMLNEEILKYDDGANPIRIVISAIPVVIAFVGRKKIESANNPLINICVNMSVFTMLTFFVATFTNGVGTGRLPIYTGLFNLILIPYLAKNVFDEKISKNIKLFFVIFYIAYFFYSMFTGAQ
ncbi:EpsG family protein [Ruminococcus sp. JE7B6]|uniref:EpsG family protein n=1 Tax=Ruminococcus sp. JE7B6 TaxID=3233380 RepID=UPI00389A15D0